MMPRLTAQRSGGDIWGLYTWRRNNRASDLSFVVEYTENLISPWTPVNPAQADFSETVLNDDVDADGSAALIQTGAKIPPSGNLFFRLKVEKTE